MVITVISAVALILWLVFVFAVVRSGGAPKGVDQTKARAFLTFRISNIPRKVTKCDFQEILASLAEEMSTSLGAVSQPNLVGWSFAPAAAPQLSQRFSVATITFCVSPTAPELEATIKRRIGVEAGRLTVDLDFFGLTPLADPQQGAAVE